MKPDAGHAVLKTQVSIETALRGRCNKQASPRLVEQKLGSVRDRPLGQSRLLVIQIDSTELNLGGTLLILPEARLTQSCTCGHLWSEMRSIQTFSHAC